MRSLILAFALSAVASTSFASEDNFNPVTVDPSKFELAFLLPQNLGLQKGSLKLTLSGTLKIKSETVSEDYFLQRSDSLIGSSQGLVPQKNGAHYAVFRIATKDLVRIRHQQRTIQQWKETYPDDISGSIDMDASLCQYGTLNKRARARMFVNIGYGFEQIDKGTVKDLMASEGVSSFPNCS